MLEATPSPLERRAPCASHEVEWLGLRARVPADWDIVKHGLGSESGSLVFVDRRRQRMTLSWTQCRSKPDLGRLVKDFRRSALSGAKAEAFRRRADWRGWLETGDDVVMRAARYHAATRRLIEVTVVCDPDANAGHFAGALLDRVEVTAPAEQATRVCAFGLRVTAPEGMHLVRATPKPADVELEFARHDDNRRKPDTACVRRLGMARAWYSGDARAVIERDAPGARFSTFEAFTHSGGSGARAEGFEAGAPLRRWLGLLRHQRVSVWHCRAENAVYELTTRCARRDALDDAELRVDCGAEGE